MRTLILILLCVLSISCAKKYENIENKDSDYQVIPKPVKLTATKGRFLVDQDVKVSGEASLNQEKSYLAEMLSLATGKTITTSDNAEEDQNIVLVIDDAITNDEGYKLSVSTNGVKITGKTAKGVFYGIQTLRQLLPAKIEVENGITSELTLPNVTIEDAPSYVYRGMHLDVGRHMFPVTFIKKYIDLIALHKMNTFHWHLTEDQGWRIEIKKYPKLTEIGAWRNGTIVGHHPGTENDEKKYGGFYTQEEVKDVVVYAASKHITVIPEIELPGHSSAAIAAYPQLSCFPNEPTIVTKNMGSKKGKENQSNSAPKIVQETWGVFDDVYCAGNEQTFTFLQDVLDEVILLFPSKYIHIGGDECPKSNWKKCSDCQARIKKEGLKDEHELQSYFITRIEKYLNAKGKNIIGWDEILEGGLAPNATVMSWRGESGGIQAAKQHHNVVMTPGSHCYFDHYQVPGDQQVNEPVAICCYTSVEEVYSYNPTPKELTKEEAKYILGAQGNVWTEYMKTPDHVEYMILPRMTALSEVVWTPKEAKDWNDFKERLVHFKDRYEALKLNYAKHIFKASDSTTTN